MFLNNFSLARLIPVVQLIPLVVKESLIVKGTPKNGFFIANSFKESVSRAWEHSTSAKRASESASSNLMNNNDGMNDIFFALKQTFLPNLRLSPSPNTSDWLSAQPLSFSWYGSI